MPPPPLLTLTESSDPTANLVTRLRSEIQREPAQVAFLFGSGAVAPYVPGVAGTIALARWWNDGTRGDDPIETAGPNAYAEVLRDLEEKAGPKGRLAFVQRIALDAYDGRDATDLKADLDANRVPIETNRFQSLTRNPELWRIPPGLDDFAEIFAQTDELPRHILTTNFDPLIEVALRRHGLSVHSLSAAVNTDPGSFRPNDPRDAVVVHVHGDCLQGLNLNTPAELQSRRDEVLKWLRQFLGRKSQLVVVGYSGWSDMVTGVIRELPVDVTPMWPVREKLEEATQKLPHLPPLLAELSNVTPYFGVDRDVLFSGLREALLPRTASRRRSQTGLEKIMVSLEELGFGSSSVSRTEAPELIFWPHRLREVHLIHGVCALAAACLKRACPNATVVLCLDDVDIPAAAADALIGTWKEAMTGWSDHLSVEAPQIHRYSRFLGTDGRPPSGAEAEAELWNLIDSLTRSAITVGDLFAITKVAQPGQLDSPPASSSGDAIRGLLSARVDGRLLRPIYTYYVLGQILKERDLSTDQRSVITLGGEDEAPLWDVWDRIYPRAAGHIYVPRLNWPGDTGVWRERRLLRATKYRRRDLKQFILRSHAEAQSQDLMTWLLDCGMRLPTLARTMSVPDSVVFDSQEIHPTSVGTWKVDISEENASALAAGISEWFYAYA